jgi:hypothetical protein
LILASAALAAACATAPAGPVPNVAGEWVGEFNPIYNTFGSDLLPSSLAHVELRQNGSNVTGSFHSLGLSGSIWGRLDGNQLSANLDGQTATNEGNASIDGKFTGDTLQAYLENNPITLKRVHPTDAVAMQNARTKQVILCQGSATAIQGCVKGLSQDGWKRLSP